MLDVLAPDVALHSDGEGKAPLRVITSAQGGQLHARDRPGSLREAEMAVHWVDVNGRPGLYTTKKPVSVVTVELDRAGRIEQIYLMAAPSKLSRLVIE